jgi:hypothetical protein
VEGVEVGVDVGVGVGDELGDGLGLGDKEAVTLALDPPDLIGFTNLLVNV